MSKKNMEHAPKTCGGLYEMCHSDDGVPFLKCGKCEHILDDWNKWMKTYSNYWMDDSKWDSKKDLPTCLLGYFGHVFKTYYGVDFALSLNSNGIFKGSEMVQIRRLLASFGGDAKTARKYIDWIFKSKVGQRKRKITSLGFLNTAALINEFNIQLKRSAIITRSTALPEKMRTWLQTNAKELFDQMPFVDCGDLHMFLKHYKNGVFSFDCANAFVKKLQTSGLVDQDLNIKNWGG